MEEIKKSQVFTREPAINVISKDEFESRVEKVFHLLWKTLAKSFGPYGAPTLILNYPFSHVTKDGYTIMKNLSMNTSETLVDQAINDMAADICGRLNYSVGDGTTTAVIATDSIYKNYRLKKEELANRFILPRDVISKYNVIKGKVEERLKTCVKEIKSDDPDTLYKNIYDVVYISSNADTQITEYIANLYKELKFPAISCELAPDGITKAKLIEGYSFNMSLNDKLYINSDDGVMRLDNADIIIFSVKITKDIYDKILQPLNLQSKLRGRHLVVAAPFYDDTALSQVIRRDLNAEYKKNNDVNMVLMTYRNTSGYYRKLLEDFACLMNTMVIDRTLCQSILEDIGNGKNILEVLNMDDRKITGTKCVATFEKNPFTYNYGIDTLPEGSEPLIAADENAIPIGFTRNCSLGMKTSMFTDFVYDEGRFNIIYNDAKTEMEETEARYQKLGTFNLEVSQAQQRFYSLNLKMGIVEVGADSELSQKLLKDAVDDAIRAAASAYDHGVVLGCNTNLIQVIRKLKEEATDYTDQVLLAILYEGFVDVYRTVLSNAFDDVVIEDADTYRVKEFMDSINIHAFEYNDDLDDVINDIRLRYGKVSIYNIFIYYGLSINKVFDVSTFTYSDVVVNSTQTDIEVLKATIDLITLLIVGNQMIVTQRHNF